jgi:DNA-binding XRE family transcriptional regulator
MYFCDMKTEDKKKIAQTLYIKLGKSQKEISESVGVTEKTLKNWREKGNWDTLRAGEVSTPDELARSLYAQIQKISDHARDMNEPLTPSDTDQISKLSKAISNIKQKPTLGVISYVMEDFAQFLKKVNLGDAQVLIRHQMSFLEQKAKEA